MNKFLSIFLSVFFAFFIVTGCGDIDNSGSELAQENAETETDSSDSAPAEDNNNVEDRKDESELSNTNDNELTSDVKTIDNPRSGSLETLKIHFIDVGQADAALVEYTGDGEQYYLLIDAGHFSGNDVVEYLKITNVTHLDILIGTHPHADHIGQMEQIIEQFPVTEVWMSGDISESETFKGVITAINNSDADYHEPRAGEIYDIGPLEMLIIHPESITGDANQGSISMKLTYGDMKFIFTGDAETAAEQDMINRGFDLSAQILRIGHHGSHTSTSLAFLEAVSPDVGIYSAGVDNSYGHPHDEVIDLVLDYGTEVFGTDIHGTIIVETDGNSYQIKTNKVAAITPPSSESNNDAAVPAEPVKQEENVATPTDCIDINSATIEELSEINHIDIERATELIELRPFSAIKELNKIRGIGPARVADIVEQNLACIGG